MKGNFVSSSSREQLLFHFHRLLRHLSHPHLQRLDGVSHTDTCMPRSQTEHITSAPEGAPPWGARPPQRRRRSESLARASAHVLGCRVNRFATCAWAPFFFFFLPWLPSPVMTSTNSVHLRLVPVARPLVSDRGHVAGRPFGSAAAASVCSVRRLRRALYAEWFISSLKSARESVLLPFWRRRMETYGGDDFPRGSQRGGAEV